MDHAPTTSPKLRQQLRIYLVRYRHLPPMTIATVALDELETALALLQLSVTHLPAEGAAASQVRNFLTGRILDQEEM